MTGEKPHHHGNLKQALLDLALDAARQGTIEDMSLRSASRALGVSPGAVYRHFADKESLLRCLAREGFDRLAEAFEHAMPFSVTAHDRAEAEARFTALGTAYVDFATRHYGLWRLMFGPFGAGSLAAPDDRPNTFDWLRKALDDLHATGAIRHVPDRAAADFAWCAIHGLADLQSSPAVPARDLRAAVALHCRLIVAALDTADAAAGTQGLPPGPALR